MSNLETDPAEVVCATGTDTASRVEILTAREVPLGGPRAMTVRRTLPQRQRSLIGAWCFADHYGPDDVDATGGMDVAPHPHTGLQTASWLFTGEIEHRDSHGVHAMVRPGELNLMTSGLGICHSEVSTPATTILHGVQLWIALPESARNAPRDFRHYAPPLIDFPGGSGRIFLGSLLGETSPVPTHTPLLGAELTLEPRARVELAVDPTFEHGFLVDTGTLTLDGTDIERGHLGYLGTGLERIELIGGPRPTRVMVLGGTPFGEEIVMWWNFVARTHEQIVEASDQWQGRSERFGRVAGYLGEPQRLPAPPLPNARIKPRTNPPTSAPQ